MAAYAGDASGSNPPCPWGKIKYKNTKHNKLKTGGCPVVGFIPSLEQTAPIQPCSWAPPCMGMVPHHSTISSNNMNGLRPDVGIQIVCPAPPGPYTLAQTTPPSNTHTLNNMTNQTTNQQENSDGHVDIFPNNNDDDNKNNNNENNHDESNDDDKTSKDETKKRGCTQQPRITRPKTTAHLYSSTQSQGKLPKRASAVNNKGPPTTSECLLGADLATVCRTSCMFCKAQFWHHGALVLKEDIHPIRFY